MSRGANADNGFMTTNEGSNMKAWRNTVLRFGLVSVPVSVSPAKTDKPSVGAHHYDPATRERARQSWTIDGETVLPETVLLYDVDGEAVEIPAPRVGNDGRVLDGADEDDPKEIVLEAFLDAGDIDPLLYDSSYCLFPGKGGAEFGAVVGMLRGSGKVLAGTARFTDRPRSVVLRYCEAAGSVVLHTLTFTSRVRFAAMSTAAGEIKTPSEAATAQALALASALPKSWTPLDVDALESATLAALAAVKPEADIAEVATTDADILATLRGDVEAMRDEAPTTSGAAKAKRKGGSSTSKTKTNASATA